MSSVNDKIPEGWVETTLGEVSNIQSGGTPSTKNESYWGDEISWITPKDLSGYNNVYIEKGERSISKVGLENSSAKLLPKNTILFSSRAPIGYVVIAKNEITTNQGFKNIVCDEVNSHFKYFYYLMKYKAELIERLSSGSTFSEASASLIKSIDITLPPLQEQKAIAKVLTAFDHKIENLRAQNKTLETLAQTIFKEWFGKYQIGDDLPKGWRVGKLGDISTKISKGTTPRKSDIENLEASIPFLKVKDISNEGLINKNGLELIPNEVHLKQLKRSILEYNDLLFSIAGTIGRVAIIDRELGNTNCNQALAFIRLKRKDLFLEYIHLWLRSSYVQNEINFSIVQGVQANVSLTVLGNLSVIIPNEPTINKWNKLIKPVYLKMQNNNQQILSLTKTRDTLLPKLMSGQLRVNEFKI
ncbi:restriction endonuclease subunit S [Oceanihabitans sediminis]|uniref:restriction endonuclease subunit S n=1 Tax=Oceanihabitans sediminis TaxID=1812012 RepID=UPI003A8FA9D3